MARALVRVRFVVATAKRCKECPPSSKRAAPYPGPRCATHHRAVRDARKQARHAAWVRATYGLKDGQYDQLKAAQGGACAICQKATGARKKLAVDHDHKTEYVRGLLCGPCNKLLGFARDNPEFFRRAANYLENPPAFDVIGKVKPSE